MSHSSIGGLWRIGLLLVIAPAIGAQQPSLYIDLAGAWRLHGEDKPEMAQPAYDDSGWATVVMPPLRGGSELPTLQSNITPLPPSRNQVRSGWLRLAVDLPEWADRSKLALTLGPFRSVYMVYVNGIEIASVGRVDTRATSQVARARTFPIPEGVALRTPKLHIAIRFGPPMGGGYRFRIDQQAPYLLSYMENAPVNAGVESLLLRRASFTPGLIISIVCAGLAILLLLVWYGDRTRGELLWLALFLAVNSFHEAFQVFQLAPDSTPFNHYGVPSVSVISQTATWTLFASFVIAATGTRALWLHAILWSGWLAAALILAGPGGFAVFRGTGALSGGVSVAVILAAWWKLARQRAPLRRHLLFVALLMPSAYQLWVNTAGGAELFLEVSGYYLEGRDLFTLILISLILVLLLRQVAMDRRDRQRLQGEMEAARTAQLFLLGSGEAIHTPQFEVEAVYEPALEVGGDFHWTRVAPDGSLLAVVGDVSGKGLRAAMLVSVVIGILRTEKSQSPAVILHTLNDGLVGQTGGGFVTCCCGHFDPSGAVTLSNAGHPQPYCDGQEFPLEAGLPLGLLGDPVGYVETVVRGTRFTFVSDGVVEAANGRGELFGFERTRQISGKPAAGIAATARAWGQNDDITVVTIERRAE